MRDVTPDLFFASIAEREVQYNARASVADFDACVRRYAESAARVRAAGRAEPAVRHGPDERLDLFLPAAAQASAPLFVFIHGGYWRSQRKEDAPVMAEAFNAAGAAVATLEYTLLPEATLPEVVREVRSAVAGCTATPPPMAWIPRASTSAAARPAAIWRACWPRRTGRRATACRTT